MRVMVFEKAVEDSEKGVPPTAEAFEAMDQFIEELVKAGVFVAVRCHADGVIARFESALGQSLKYATLCA